MLQNFLKIILKKLYKVEIKGIENYQKQENRVLIIANHLSFLDALLIAVFLPEKNQCLLLILTLLKNGG